MRTTYGDNYPRLIRIKAYDPHNPFRTNRNVLADTPRTTGWAATPQAEVRGPRRVPDRVRHGSGPGLDHSAAPDGDISTHIGSHAAAVGQRRPSAGRVTLAHVRVTETVLADIPPGNLRVRRGDFAAVWDAAERRSVEQGARGVTDWYAAAVAVTCRWLATAVVQTHTGRRHLALSPVTNREARAYEELIEAEYLAAERLDLREPELQSHRPGWCEGVQRTFRWAWRHDGPPPFPVSAMTT